MSEFRVTKLDAKVFNECFFYVQPVSISSRDSILFANAYGITKEECIANAKLISCAPEMLEFLHRIESSENTPAEYRRQAKQLIKKATEL